MKYWFPFGVLLTSAAFANENFSCESDLNPVPVPDSISLVPYEPDARFHQSIYEKVTFDHSTSPPTLKVLEVDYSKAEQAGEVPSSFSIIERPDLSGSNWFLGSRVGKTVGTYTIDYSLSLTRVFFKGRGFFSNGREDTQEEVLAFYVNHHDPISNVYHFTQQTNREYAYAAILGESPDGPHAGLHTRPYLWISKIYAGDRHSVDTGFPMRELLETLLADPQLLRKARVILKLHSHPGMTSGWEEAEPGLSSADLKNDNYTRRFMDENHSLKHLVLSSVVMQFQNLRNPYLIHRVLYPLDENVNRLTLQRPKQ